MQERKNLREAKIQAGIEAWKQDLLDSKNNQNEKTNKSETSEK